MKLWTTLQLDRLPEVLKNGFDNPNVDEITFWNDIRMGADSAISEGEQIAFIQAELPDDQLELYFGPCVSLLSDAISDAESAIAYAEDDEESVRRLDRNISTMQKIETAKDSLDYFGYACLVETLPPTMLKLLDLEQILEALESGDADAVVHAVETAEATPFKALSATFWVWLIMLIEQIFGPGQGPPVGSEEAQEKVEEEEAERIERMRIVASRRPRRKKKAKKRS